MDKQYKAFLVVRDMNRNEIDRIGLSSLDENYVERVMMGMLRNMDTDNYFIDDSEVDKARATNEHS